MNHTRFFMAVLISLALFPPSVSATDIHSRYTTISYENDALLETFNNRLFMGRLRYLMRGTRPLTVEDEVKNKLDVITQNVETILEMYPPNLHYSVSLCTDMDQVNEALTTRHPGAWHRAGFYSTGKDTVYLSVPDTGLKVVAHEVGHVVVEKYFKTKPPVKVHELLAQFVEKHIAN
jgi:hypothetical protein